MENLDDILTLKKQVEALVKQSKDQGTELPEISDELLKWLYSLGYHLYQNAKYEDAESVFFLLSTLSPLEKKSWMGLGASRQMGKKFEDAIEAYEAVCLLDDNREDPYPHWHAAECFLAINDNEQAMKALDAVEYIAKKRKEHKGMITQVQLLLSSRGLKNVEGGLDG